jgi:general secretion pathway protein E
MNLQGRSTATRVSSAQNSHGHIRRFSEVPHLEVVLSHGPNSVLKLLDDKQQSMLAGVMQGRHFCVISLQREQGSPAWFHLIEQGKEAGYTFAGFYTCDDDVMATLLQRFNGSTTADQRRKQTEGNQAVFDRVVGESEQIHWFRQLVKACLDLQATDIHIETRGHVADVRIRRDGILRQIKEYPADICTQAIAACYTLLAEERSRSEVAFNVNSVQSAMIPMSVGDRQVSLRYQSHPSVGGYEVVIRILKTDSHASNTSLTLESLGYTSDQIDLLVKALASSVGGVFVAGVTGSGKTTTLSAMLSRLAREGSRKIIAIEDPVEYIVPGVSHLSIQRSMMASQGTVSDNPFYASMMAFLRMDPDIGMFGEIRDAISGQMAYTAIQTGHKLLTTVHATSALGVVARLASPQIGLLRNDVCVPDFFSALVYQALVPLNCKACMVPATSVMDTGHLKLYEQLFQIDPDHMNCASAEGCPKCLPDGMKKNPAGHNGIRGMKVSAEVITPDIELLELLRRNEDLRARDVWRSHRTHAFTEPVMRGKPSWAHSLYDVSKGIVDPYFFEHVYGHPSQLVQS